MCFRFSNVPNKEIKLKRMAEYAVVHLPGRSNKKLKSPPNKTGGLYSVYNCISLNDLKNIIIDLNSYNKIRYNITYFHNMGRSMINYGYGGCAVMIRIYLSKLLGEQRINQAELSRMTGIRPNTVGEIYHELTERVSLEHLDLICEALDCRLDELISREPNKKSKVLHTRAGALVRQKKNS